MEQPTPQLPPQGPPMFENGMCLMMADFRPETVKPIIEWISNENRQKKKKEYLTLVICSPGGDVSACFALIDTMKGSAIPIRTVGIGIIASCGLLTFIAGEKGHRTLTPNTSILSHQYSWGSRGKEHELYGIQREFELSSKRMVDHYKKCTGLTEKVIRDKLLPPTDVWLDAKEAKKYKLCDTIKTTY